MPVCPMTSELPPQKLCEAEVRIPAHRLDLIRFLAGSYKFALAHRITSAAAQFSKEIETNHNQCQETSYRGWCLCDPARLCRKGNAVDDALPVSLELPRRNSGRKEHLSEHTTKPSSKILLCIHLLDRLREQLVPSPRPRTQIRSSKTQSPRPSRCYHPKKHKHLKQEPASSLALVSSAPRKKPTALPRRRRNLHTSPASSSPLARRNPTTAA